VVLWKSSLARNRSRNVPIHSTFLFGVPLSRPLSGALCLLALAGEGGEIFVSSLAFNYRRASSSPSPPGLQPFFSEYPRGIPSLAILGGHQRSRRLGDANGAWQYLAARDSTY
jgi:hypothetical protein